MPRIGNSHSRYDLGTVSLVDESGGSGAGKGRAQCIGLSRRGSARSNGGNAARHPASEGEPGPSGFRQGNGDRTGPRLLDPAALNAAGRTRQDQQLFRPLPLTVRHGSRGSTNPAEAARQRMASNAEPDGRIALLPELDDLVRLEPRTEEMAQAAQASEAARKARAHLEVLVDDLFKGQLISERLSCFQAQRGAELLSKFNTIQAKLRPDSPVSRALSQYKADFDKNIEKLKADKIAVKQMLLDRGFGDLEGLKGSLSSTWRHTFTGYLGRGACAAGATICLGLLVQCGYAALASWVCANVLKAMLSESTTTGPTECATTSAVTQGVDVGSGGESCDFSTFMTSAYLPPGTSLLGVLLGDGLINLIPGLVASILSPWLEKSLLDEGGAAEGQASFRDSVRGKSILVHMATALTGASVDLIANVLSGMPAELALARACAIHLPGALVECGIDFGRSKWMSDMSAQSRFWAKKTMQVGVAGPLQQTIRSAFDGDGYLKNILCYGLIQKTLQQIPECVFFWKRESVAPADEKMQRHAVEARTALQKMIRQLDEPELRLEMCRHDDMAGQSRQLRQEIHDANAILKELMAELDAVASLPAHSDEIAEEARNILDDLRGVAPDDLEAGGQRQEVANFPVNQGRQPHWEALALAR